MEGIKPINNPGVTYIIIFHWLKLTLAENISIKCLFEKDTS